MNRSRAFTLILALGGLFAVALAADLLPWLRGDVPWIPLLGRWIWPYAAPRWAWVVPCALALAIYVAGAARLLDRAPRDRYPVRLIAWSFTGAALLWLLLLTLEGRPLFLLFTRSASVVTGGYQYAAALASDLDHTLRHWPDFVATYRAHANIEPPGGVTLSPPGLLAAYDAGASLLDAAPPLADRLGGVVRPLQCQNLFMMTWTDAEMASAWLQMAMPLWAALGVAPLYRLGALVWDRERARLAVVMWALVPGLAIFQPRFNVFYPLIALLVLLGVWRGLLRERPRWLAVGGFALSVGMLFNLSLVPLGLLAGLIILGWRLARPPAQPRAALRDLVAFGIGCASVWVITWALGGLSPWELARTSLDQHYDMYRPYWPWLVMHTYDMFIFVGVPVAGLAIWRIARLRRAGRASLAPGDVMAGAAALALAILVLSGTARGETGRVWLFFAPVWVLLAADVLAGFRRREQVAFLAVQAAIVLVMAGFLRANFTGLTEPAQAPPAASAPAFASDSTFRRGEDAITLVGMTVETAPGSVTLHLYWRAEAPVERPYALSLLRLGPDAPPEEAITWNPLNWNYPPSCWSPGRTFVDTVTVPLGENPAPGEWAFSLSVLDTETGAPMLVTGPDGGTSPQVGIGPVIVPAG